jgi:hypothetical protein
MFALVNRHRLPDATGDEFEKLHAQLRAFLSKEHQTDGTHRIGRWASYDVLWRASVTDPVIGNGAVQGRYVRIGNLVTYAIRVDVGSTTNVGSGTFSFTTPTPVAQSETPLYIGQAYTTRGIAAVKAYIGGLLIDDAISEYGDAYPGAWSTNDHLFLTGSYEVPEGD